MNSKTKKIGVFDSGIGGRSVANKIEAEFPDYQIIYREDSKNLPYGNKTPAQIYEFVKPIFNELSKDCEVIVIACNTVTTTIISKLRQEYNLPIIGIEPMVKPASQLTGNKIITVCATPTTLSSKRYAELKEKYTKNIQVIEPDCSDWSVLIEQNSISNKKIEEDILPSLDAGSDVIVLGCTHYHWIEDKINKIVGNRATVIQPESAIISRLKTILK
jgi:glutamate racemase